MTCRASRMRRDWCFSPTRFGCCVRGLPWSPTESGIRPEKRFLWMPKRCVLHDCREISFPQFWFVCTPKRPDFQLPVPRVPSDPVAELSRKLSADLEIGADEANARSCPKTKQHLGTPATVSSSACSWRNHRRVRFRRISGSKMQGYEEGSRWPGAASPSTARQFRAALRRRCLRGSIGEHKAKAHEALHRLVRRFRWYSALD
jgi:hypothetical protein